MDGRLEAMAEKREPNPAAQELARKRWEGTTPEQRTQHARDAARKRWGPLPKPQGPKGTPPTAS